MRKLKQAEMQRINWMIRWFPATKTNLIAGSKKCQKVDVAEEVVVRAANLERGLDGRF